MIAEVTRLSAPDAGRQILKAFVTREGTRRTLDHDSVAHAAAGFGGAIPADVFEIEACHSEGAMATEESRSDTVV